MKIKELFWKSEEKGPDILQSEVEKTIKEIMDKKAVGEYYVLGEVPSPRQSN
jgi:hypothetical protein